MIKPISIPERIPLKIYEFFFENHLFSCPTYNVVLIWPNSELFLLQNYRNSFEKKSEEAGYKKFQVGPRKPDQLNI